MTASRLTYLLVIVILQVSSLSVILAQRNGSCVVAEKGANGEIIYKILDGKSDGICEKRLRPPEPNSGPTPVYVSIFVYFLGSIEAQNLQFTAHVLVQYRWKDDRLKHAAENIEGESELKEKLWTPHLYLVNEHESKVMGSNRDDVLVSIHPDGTVYYATRLKVTLLCFMNLQKFPFDNQQCPLVLESWGYNTTQLLLKWEETEPVRVNKDLKLTEYTMSRYFTNQSTVVYSGRQQPNFETPLLYHSKFAGNYSSLSVHFELNRQVGHYIMDYYVPSILLVVVSWVSFWLDPNAVPGRTTLGTSTMLTFITLSRNIGSSLPKVSYIKATEIWFIVCTAFIFGSLVEFAFVNTIWRRRKHVELKKINSKHILKSTLTPQIKRKELKPSFSRSQSAESVSESKHSTTFLSNFGSQLTLDSTLKDASRDVTLGSAAESCVNIRMGGGETPDADSRRDGGCFRWRKRKDRGEDRTDAHKGFFMLSPQEIAQWIDKRSRILFPVLFIIFNIMYWIFVYVT